MPRHYVGAMAFMGFLAVFGFVMAGLAHWSFDNQARAQTESVAATPTPTATPSPTPTATPTILGLPRAPNGCTIVRNADDFLEKFFQGRGYTTPQPTRFPDVYYDKSGNALVDQIVLHRIGSVFGFPQYIIAVKGRTYADVYNEYARNFELLKNDVWRVLEAQVNLVPTEIHYQARFSWTEFTDAYKNPAHQWTFIDARSAAGVGDLSNHTLRCYEYLPYEDPEDAEADADAE